MPPKCGTTNWQNALANLHGKKGRAVIPSLTAYHFSDSEEFQEVKQSTKIFGERVKTKSVTYTGRSHLYIWLVSN